MVVLYLVPYEFGGNKRSKGNVGGVKTKGQRQTEPLTPYLHYLPVCAKWSPVLLLACQSGLSGFVHPLDPPTAVFMWYFGGKDWPFSSSAPSVSRRL